MQMSLATMLVNAFHAAFENAVEIFDSVCMHISAYIFIRFVTDAAMAREVLAEREIMAAFVGHHRGFFRDVRLDDRNDIGRACAIDMERAHLLALAVNKRQYRVLVAMTATLNRTFLAADASASTVLPTPPIGARLPARIASRRRWLMNQAVC